MPITHGVKSALNNVGSFPGVKPVGESWSEECVLALKRRVSNRILRADILRAHDGKALVAMFDEASDPQANVAELLICAGYAAPAPTPSPVSASGHQQVDQVAAGVTTEAQGRLVKVTSIHFVGMFVASNL